MDKFEYELKVEQIEKLIRRGDNVTAKKIADSMDWKKEKDTRLLRSVAELYVQAGEDEKALYFLRQAYNASPRGIMILERMINVALSSDNIDVAEEFCDAYYKIAPDSSEYALFRYKIAAEKQSTAAELIKWLKLYTSREMDEEYSYRLAELYEEINDRAACIRQCDYIIDFFCFGEYVDKAVALKEKFAELDEYQIRRMSQREEYEKEYNNYIKENDYRQKRQAREEAAEKQIIEAQLMEKQEAMLGEQISEIVEEQKREKEEIHLDALVMDEILAAEKELAENAGDTAEEKTASKIEEDIFGDAIKETKAAEQDDDFEDDFSDDFEPEEEEDKEPSKGFWAGIKTKLRKQGIVPEEAEEFERVKNELEDELWTNIEEAEAKVTEEEPEAVVENETVEEAEVVKEAEPAEEPEQTVETKTTEEAETVVEAETTEEPETVEEANTEEEPETVEEAETVEESETVEEPEAVVENETVEEANTVEEPEAEEETEEEIEEAEEEEEPEIKKTASEDEEDFEDEDDFDEEEPVTKPLFSAVKKRIRKKVETEEEGGLEPPEGNFMVACADLEAGVKYAIEMVKRMDKGLRFETVGKLTAREVNKFKFGVIKEQFNQDAMMITGAGELTAGAADNLHKWIKSDENNCVILVDTQQHLADLEHRSPKLMKAITAQYVYEALSKEAWLDIVEEKARLEGVILDDNAYLLYEKYLDERISKGDVIVGQDLDDALYDAIDRAEGLSLGGLIAGITASKYDQDGMLIIKDKHFS